MDLSSDPTIEVRLAVSPEVDRQALSAAFLDEGVHVASVSDFVVKAWEADAGRYFVTLIVNQTPANLVGMAEGAAARVGVQKIRKVMERFKKDRPEVKAELSVEEGPIGRSYVFPDDPEELHLAHEAVLEDIAASTPPYEKFWRHDHGWVTAEEGWRLDGYKGPLRDR